MKSTSTGSRCQPATGGRGPVPRACSFLCGGGLATLGTPEEKIQARVDIALQDPSWRSIAALDAAARMLAAIVRSGGLEAGEEAGRILERTFENNRDPRDADGPGLNDDQDSDQDAGQRLSIPETYWSVQPLPAVGEGEQPERLLLRGAVLVRILGRLEAAEVELTPGGPSVEGPPAERPSAERLEALPPDLRAALTEPSYRPESEVWQALKQDGLLTPAILAVSLLLATFGVLVEALFFLGVIQIGQSLTTPAQRIAAMGVWFILTLICCTADIWTQTSCHIMKIWNYWHQRKTGVTISSQP